MKNVPEYLAFLKEINVDVITVGDTGIIYTMKKILNCVYRIFMMLKH